MTRNQKMNIPEREPNRLDKILHRFGIHCFSSWIDIPTSLFTYYEEKHCKICGYTVGKHHK